MRVVCTFPLPTNAWEVLRVLQSLAAGPDPGLTRGYTLGIEWRFDRNERGELVLCEMTIEDGVA